MKINAVVNFGVTLGVLGLVLSSVATMRAEAASGPGLCIEAENKRFCTIEFSSVSRISKRGTDKSTSPDPSKVVILGTSALHDSQLVVELYNASSYIENNCTKTAKLVASNNSKYRLVVMFWELSRLSELVEFGGPGYASAAGKFSLLSPADLSSESVRWSLEGVSAMQDLVHVTYNADFISTESLYYQCDLVLR